MKLAADTPKLIEEIKDFFNKNNISDPNLIIEENQIILDANFLNYNILSTFVGVIALIVVYPNLENSTYKILLTLLIPVIIYILWNDFNSINKIVINLTEKCVSITSKNLLKRLFQKSIIVPFQDIYNVQSESKEFYARYRRYKIVIRTKEKEKINLIDFTQQNHALFFSAFIKRSLLI